MQTVLSKDGVDAGCAPGIQTAFYVGMGARSSCLVLMVSPNVIGNALHVLLHSVVPRYA